jgi:hypothetical protein
MDRGEIYSQAKGYALWDFEIVGCQPGGVKKSEWIRRKFDQPQTGSHHSGSKGKEG